MRNLKENTVLFGDPRVDSQKSRDALSTVENFTLFCRLKAAFAKTFPGSGYNHNTYQYYGDSNSYEESLDAKNPLSSPSSQYKKFIQQPSLKNPAVSFFGATGLKGGWQLFYAVKVPLITLINIVRLLTEYLLYVGEVTSRHLLVKSKLSWALAYRDFKRGDLDFGQAVKFSLLPVGIAVLAVGYYGFKLTRLTVRLATAPIDSAASGWGIHPALGIFSGLLSAATYAVLAVFALPAALPVIAKVAGAQAIVIISHLVEALSSLFNGASIVIPAAASLVGVAGSSILKGLRHFVHNSLMLQALSSKIPDPKVFLKRKISGLFSKGGNGQPKKPETKVDSDSDSDLLGLSDSGPLVDQKEQKGTGIPKPLSNLTYNGL